MVMVSRARLHWLQREVRLDVSLWKIDPTCHLIYHLSGRKVSRWTKSSEFKIWRINIVIQSCAANMPKKKKKKRIYIRDRQVQSCSSTTRFIFAKFGIFWLQEQSLIRAQIQGDTTADTSKFVVHDYFQPNRLCFCQQDYPKTAERISTKLDGGWVQNTHRFITNLFSSFL